MQKRDKYDRFIKTREIKNGAFSRFLIFVQVFKLCLKQRIYVNIQNTLVQILLSAL